MNINRREIGTNHRPYIIAEIGINHSGNFDIALSMIYKAALAGADAVKFQTHTDCEFSDTPAFPSNSGGESIQSLIRRCSFSEDDERKLKVYADEVGITFLSTPFTVKAVERLERIDVHAYKVGSGNVSDTPMLSSICATGKPIILSIGMHTIDEVSRAVNAIEESGNEYALLECTSSYPTRPENVRLKRIKQLRGLFPLASAIGLSDHTNDIWTSLGAIALGASIIEKHVYMPGCVGPDISSSITMGQLANLVKGSMAIYKSLHAGNEMTEEEHETRDWFERSRRGA